MTKRIHNESDKTPRDSKRDKTGWKAQIKDARRAKGKRQSAEGAVRKGWK